MGASRNGECQIGNIKCKNGIYKAKMEIAPTFCEKIA